MVKKEEAVKMCDSNISDRLINDKMLTTKKMVVIICG